MSISNDAVSESFGESIAPKLNVENVFKVISNETIQISDFIGEEKMLELLNSEQNYNIIAPMSSGKTKAVIKAALKTKNKNVLLCPLQVNVLEHLNKDVNYYYYVGRKPENIRKKVDIMNSNKSVLDARMIISVYDSSKQIFEVSGFNPKEYNLIIDESHNLVSQYGFRRDVIRGIIEEKEKFRKVIYLTGTPEGTTYFNGYSNIVFKRRSGNSRIELNIIDSKDGYQNLIIEYIKTNKINKNRKMIVLIENKDDIKTLAESIRTVIGNRDFKVATLDSESKSSDEFIHLYTNQKIHDDVACLITTSVISDGLNIQNDNIDTVFIARCGELLKIRQFLARFRKGVKNCFLVFNSKQTSNVDFPDYEKIFVRVIAGLEEYKSKLAGPINFNVSNGINDINDANYSSTTYYVKNNQTYLSKEAVAWGYLTHFERKVNGDIKSVKEYYDKVAGYKTAIMRYKTFCDKYLNGKIPEPDGIKLTLDIIIEKKIDDIKIMAGCELLEKTPKVDADPLIKDFYETNSHIQALKEEIHLMPAGIVQLLMKHRERKVAAVESFSAKFKYFGCYSVIKEFPELFAISEGLKKSNNMQLNLYMFMRELDTLLASSNSPYTITKSNKINGHKLVEDLCEKYSLNDIKYTTAIESIRGLKKTSNKTGHKGLDVTDYRDLNFYKDWLREFNNEYPNEFDIEEGIHKLPLIPFKRLEINLERIGYPDKNIKKLKKKTKDKIRELNDRFSIIKHAV